MPYSNYIIRNCSAKNGACVCPKLWSKLKPAFSDMVRHCDSCNKKVYLCETEEQVKFYSSVKFCIAVAASEQMSNEVENPPSIPVEIADTKTSNAKHDAVRDSSCTVPNVWRREPLPRPLHELQHDDIPTFLRKGQRSLDEEMPAFMRRQKQ
jgi:hypothetical protein